MDEDVDVVVDDLLSQLKGANLASKEIEKNEFNLDKDKLEDFLLKYSSDLHCLYK